MDIMTEGAVASHNEEHSKEHSEPEDVRELKVKLERLERANSELAQQLEQQKTHNKQLLLGGRLKSDATNDVITTQAKERDQQLAEITSDLMYFESRLLKSKERAKNALSEKNKQIRELQRKAKHQEKQINALNRANENLLTSLHELRDNYDEQKRDSVSGYDPEQKDPSVSGVQSGSPSGVRYANGAEYHQNGLHTERKPDRDHRHLQNGETQSDRWLNVPSLSQFNSGQRRTRKLSDINGRTPCTLYDMNTNTIALPRSPQPSHRVRFTPDVKEIQEEEEEEEEQVAVKVKVKETMKIVKPVLKLRKISLPAYRLPTTEDENEEFL